MSFINTSVLKKSLIHVCVLLSANFLMSTTTFAADSLTNYGHRHWNQAPEPTTGLRILNLNVENYFNGDYKKGKFDYSESRGPRSQAEYQDKRIALTHLIQAVKADILVLEEVENDSKELKPALLDLTNSLKEVTGVEYKPVEFNARYKEPYGRDAITQYILYRDKPGLELIGKAKSIKDKKGGRPSIVQTFSYKVNETDVARFTLAASHLKSKRNTCGVDKECAEKRTAQAKAFSKALSSYGDKGTVIWVGDFNSEPYQPAMQALSHAGWDSMLDMAQYTYVYQGQKKLLDHVLVKSINKLGKKNTLTAQVWNINNPPEGTLGKQNSVSDHDPIIIDLHEKEF